jgi:hypothetical protein
MGGPRTRNSLADARELFPHDDLGELINIGSSIFLWVAWTEIPQLSHLRKQLKRKGLRLLRFLHEGSDFFLTKSPKTVPKDPMALVQREIQVDPLFTLV